MRSDCRSSATVSYVRRCRLAWDIFFPDLPQVFSPAGAVKSRLQMILVSDRSVIVWGKSVNS